MERPIIHIGRPPILNNHWKSDSCIIVPTVPKPCPDPEAVVDCVGKPRIFIQCSCLIVPLHGYESALLRTRLSVLSPKLAETEVFITETGSTITETELELTDIPIKHRKIVYFRLLVVGLNYRKGAIIME